MGDDPRWQRMLDFVTWAAKHAGADGDEFARRFQEDYIGLAEAIAADRAAPPGDRSFAQKILADLNPRAPAHAPRAPAPGPRSERPRGDARRIRRVAGARRRADAGGFGPPSVRIAGPEERR